MIDKEGGRIRPGIGVSVSGSVPGNGEHRWVPGSREREREWVPRSQEPGTQNHMRAPRSQERGTHNRLAYKHQLTCINILACLKNAIKRGLRCVLVPWERNAENGER
jgi:hypothetical protein